MRSHLSALRLGSLKVRLTLASVALILVSVALTVHLTLREVRQGSERIVLDDRARTMHADSPRIARVESAGTSAPRRRPCRAQLDEPAAAAEARPSRRQRRPRWPSSWSLPMAACSPSPIWKTATAMSFAIGTT